VWHAVCGGAFGFVRGGWVVCTDPADFGRTVLHKAVGRGAAAVAGVLAAAGAEVSHVLNHVDADCETPLFAAVARGDAAAAALLLRAGADVNAANRRDVTPLMHAARHCDAACARALLAAGADASLRADGRTARDQCGMHCLDERPCDSYEATAALLAGSG
jgi:ankyrin repeat protein